MPYKKMMEMMGKGNSYENKKPNEKSKAKREVVHDLRKMAMDAMGEGMDDRMKKVTVASDTGKGMEEGLKQASEMVEMKNEHSYDPEGSKYAGTDYSNDDYSGEDDYEYENVEEIDEKIAELMKMKEMMEMEG